VGSSYLEALASNEGLSDQSRHIINCSWRPATKDKYEASITKWAQYCSMQGICHTTPQIEHIISFLTELFVSGKSYRTILGYRSAINAVAKVAYYPDICQHPLMQRFVRGVYNIRPPIPRFSRIWDVNTVFTYIKQMGDNDTMPMVQLSMKVATLLMLLTGKRCNSIDSFDVNYMDLTGDYCIFYPTYLLKHHRPGQTMKAIKYRAFHDDTVVCPVQAIADYYVRRSEYSTKSTKFFVSTKPPHDGAKKDTIANWVKRLLVAAGVDTRVYKTHSCRSAATSKALDLGLPLQTVLAAGDWSSQTTFFRHYRKEILQAFPSGDPAEVDVGNILLSNLPRCGCQY